VTTADFALAPAPPAPRLLRWLGTLVDWCVICIGAMIAVLVFFNVCLHLFSKDLAWVTELGELLMVWVTFLGGAAAARRGNQMSITEFIDKFSPAHRRWADVAVVGLCLVMLGILVWYGWRLVMANWGNELTVLGWPMAIQYMGMAVGVTCMFAFVGYDWLQALRGVSREARYPASH
jgi:TRAP-type transport system small permease protein